VESANAGCGSVVFMPLNGDFLGFISLARVVKTIATTTRTIS
jgi:hypothetical protein